MAARRIGRSRLAFRIYSIGLVQAVVVLIGFVVLMELNRPPPPEQYHAEEQALARAVESNLGDPRAVLRELEAAREPTELEATVVDPTGAVVATTVPDGEPQCFVDLRMGDGSLRGAPRLEGRRLGRPERGGPRGGGPHADGPRGGGIPRGGPPGGGPPGGGPRRGGPPGAASANTDKPVCYRIALEFPAGAFGHIEFRRMHPVPLSPFSPVVVGLVLLVVAAASWLLARSLSRPLGKLATAARVLGEGDLSARAHIERRDELGVVGAAFDEMAGRVEELVYAQKELMANVSHELRTPLARIRVALDLASEGNAEIVQEALVDITDDLLELERLIGDVLSTARFDLAASGPRGIPPLRKQPLSLEEVLQQSASRFRRAYPRRTLQLSLADDLPTLDADPVLLRRVIDNLLDNAHKYSDDPSTSVELHARHVGGGARIEVHDEGMGIAPQDRDAVFRPFFRVDRSRNRSTGGVGLGLALVKRIVEAHSGSIDLESTLGRGTVVIVRIPAESPR